MPIIRRGGRPGLLGLAARTAVVAGTANAVSGGMRSQQQARAQEQQQAEQLQAQQQEAAMQAAAQQAVAAHAAAQAAPAPAAPAQPAADAGANDLLSQLTQLGALHAQGILSADEFSAAKAKLLA